MDGLADVVVQLMDERMLLLVFLHLFLDETESAVDDLLVELQLGLLLVEVLLGTSDLDRVEVQKLVFLLEYLQEALGLHSFVKNLGLDASSQFDLLLVHGFHLLSFLLDLVDLEIQFLDLPPSLFLLLSDGLLHIKVFLPFLGNEPVELLDLALVRLVLGIRLLNNLVFLRYLA